MSRLSAGTSRISIRDCAAPPNNTLARAEKAAGWKLLFDGQSFAGWHNFKQDGVRPGWQVKDGCLVCVDPHTAGDIVHRVEYVLGSDDFKARVAKSKFAKMPFFAKAASGYIGLQGDHGSIFFRNIKLRPLPVNQ